MEQTEQDIAIYGASGHAKVIIDVLKRRNFTGEIVLFDDDPEKKMCLLFPVQKPSKKLFENKHFIFGVGNNRTRKKLAKKLKGQVEFAPAVIHPSAEGSPFSNLGKGSVVFANACINPGAILGEHCIINTAAVVEHDCRIDDFAHISPNAALAGNVHIGEGTHIGIGANVIQGIRVGKWCTIGAGAVIIRDIPDFATVVGNPGKRIR